MLSLLLALLMGSSPELPGQGRDFFLKRREEPARPVRFDVAPTLAGYSGAKQSAFKTTCAQHAAFSPLESEEQRTTCSLVVLELCVISRDALPGIPGKSAQGAPGSRRRCFSLPMRSVFRPYSVRNRHFFSRLGRQDLV